MQLVSNIRVASNATADMNSAVSRVLSECKEMQLRKDKPIVRPFILVMLSRATLLAYDRWKTRWDELTKDFQAEVNFMPFLQSLYAKVLEPTKR